MRTALLLALTLLLIAPEALALRAPYLETRRVVVEDYTAAAWEGVIAGVVADFNAVMPARVPRLDYERKAETACDAIPKRRGKRKRIVICSVPAQQHFGEYWGGGTIKLFGPATDPPSYNPSRRAIVCHETMHAVTLIRDNTGAAPDTSCVWGSLSSPGSFDVAYAKKVYKQRQKHR